jgi:hypothetical protein
MRIGLKIILFCLIPTVVFTGVVLYIANDQVRATATAVANYVLESKLSAEMNDFNNEVQRAYGQMNLHGAMLFDERGVSLAGRYEVVDRISKSFGSTATIFARDGDDFVRTARPTKVATGAAATSGMPAFLANPTSPCMSRCSMPRAK